VLAPTLDQVGARDDAQQHAALVHDGNLPPAGAHHALLQDLDGVGGLHGDLARLHDLAHAAVAHAVTHRPVYGVARQQPNDAPLLHDREAFVTGALHPVYNRGDVLVGTHRLRPDGHQRGDQH